MKKFLLFVLLAALASAAGANDLDKLKKLEDKIKETVEPSSPAPQAPASAQGAPAAQAPTEKMPAIPPIGNVPEADEIKIGRQIAGNLLGAAPLVKNPALQGYVNRVGRWVASASERPDLKWTFGVIESNDVNAFAAPGG